MARTEKPSNKSHAGSQIRKARDPEITWITGAIFAATVVRPSPTGLKKDAPRLAVTVQQDLGGDFWSVIAFEIRRHNNVQAVLDNHAHKVVGEYPSITEAILTAESYAKAWFNGQESAKLETCECGEIDPDILDKIDAEFEPEPAQSPVPQAAGEPCYCSKMNNGRKHFHVVIP